MKTQSLFLVGLMAVTTVANVALGSAELFRLDRVSIVRFTDLGNNRLKGDEGVLHLDKTVRWGSSYEIDRPSNIPGWAVGRHLVRVEAWMAYRKLGGTALELFELLEYEARVPIGDAYYFVVGVRENAFPYNGRLVNISTRVRLHGEDDVVVAGFAVEDHARMVLVRAVGPALAGMGVQDAHPDPFLSLIRGGFMLALNNNWSESSAYANVIRQVSARVGAFPLAEGSRDAAHVMILNPGIYTVHARSAPGGGAGTILVEVYTVSEEDFPDDSN